MGVPFTVIVGDSTLETGAVAVRNRDTSIRVCMLVIPPANCVYGGYSKTCQKRPLKNRQNKAINDKM